MLSADCDTSTSQHNPHTPHTHTTHTTHPPTHTHTHTHTHPARLADLVPGLLRSAHTLWTSPTLRHRSIITISRLPVPCGGSCAHLCPERPVRCGRQAKKGPVSDNEASVCHTANFAFPTRSIITRHKQSSCRSMCVAAGLGPRSGLHLHLHLHLHLDRVPLPPPSFVAWAPHRMDLRVSSVWLKPPFWAFLSPSRVEEDHSMSDLDPSRSSSSSGGVMNLVQIMSRFLDLDERWQTVLVLDSPLGRAVTPLLGICWRVPKAACWPAIPQRKQTL